MYGSLMCFKGFSIFDTSLKRWEPVHGWTIGQYIGLDDINGFFIFEDDLVYESGVKRPLRVVFRDFRYVVENEDGTYVSPIDEERMYEIIGTIQDNPELFKGGQNE